MGGPRPIASGAGVLVVDATGVAFNALRTAKLGLAIWRVTGRIRSQTLKGIGLAVVAAYGRPDWQLVSELAEQVRTIIISSAPDDDEATRAIALGAFGYIASTIPAEALRRSILAALDGEPAYSRRLLAERLRTIDKPQYSGQALALTTRQREVLTLIAKGAADKEIARALGITTATAQKHVTNLLKRLGAPNRAAAAAILVSSTAWFTVATTAAAGDTVLRSAS